MDEIIYSIEKSLEPAEFIEVLKNSGLDKRRPVNDEPRIIAMCKTCKVCKVGKGCKGVGNKKSPRRRLA